MIQYLETLPRTCLTAAAAGYACFAVYAILNGVRRASDFVTFTFPVLAADLAPARAELCLQLAAGGAAARLVLHYLQRQWRPQHSWVYEVMLIPLRASLLLAEWAAIHVGSRVRWCNQVLEATAERIQPPPTCQDAPRFSSPN